MYIITKKSDFGNFDLFYQFSSDEKDLYCVATADLQSCRKYSEEDKLRLGKHDLLKVLGVSFKKVEITV